MELAVHFCGHFRASSCKSPLNLRRCFHVFVLFCYFCIEYEVPFINILTVLKSRVIFFSQKILKA